MDASLVDVSVEVGDVGEGCRFSPPSPQTPTDLPSLRGMEAVQLLGSLKVLRHQERELGWGEGGGFNISGIAVEGYKSDYTFIEGAKVDLFL
uniref:Uncharacterized protein n=1 Tax=Oryza nivara TaxID=4536 RepID=A0A0E0HXQ0_ORYNI